MEINDINKELAERFAGVLQIMRVSYESQFGYRDYGVNVEGGPADVKELGFCECSNHAHKNECHLSPCICSDSTDDLYIKTLGYEQDWKADDEDENELLFPDWYKNKITLSQLKDADIEKVYEYLCLKGYLKQWVKDYLQNSIEALS